MKKTKGAYNAFEKLGHSCNIKENIQDPIEVVISKDVKHYKFYQKWAKCRTVTENDAIAKKWYRSQYAIDKEKIRHLLMYSCMIHPLSQLRKWWEVTMIVSIILNLMWFPFDMAFIELSVGFDKLDALRVTLQLILCADIILTFFTGFQYQNGSNACLNPAVVAWRYCKGEFLVHVVSSVPWRLFVSTKESTYYDVVHIMKLWRLRTLFGLTDNLSMRMEWEIVTERVVKIVMVCIVHMHWIICLQFIAAFMATGSRSIHDVHGDSWIKQHEVANYTTANKYLMGFYRAAFMVTLQGYGINFPRSAEDQILVCIIWLSTLFLDAGIMACVLTSLLGASSSKSKNYIMVNQLEAFMERKELPKPLRGKLVNFYKIRFRESYFQEQDILDCTSGRLKQDLLLHSCRQVVEEVPFLKNMPPHLLPRIVAVLRSEIFLPDEVIIDFDSTGSRLYFIVSGEVAVYSSDGTELYHLQQGSRLGGFGGPIKAVAVGGACELFRLDRAAQAAAATRQT